MGDFTMLYALMCWNIVNTLLAGFYCTLLENSLNKIDNECGGYLDNNWIKKILFSLGLLYLLAISNCLLTLTDVAYFYFIYVPDIGLSFLYMFKYIFYIISIISTISLINSIKIEIKLVEVKELV